jgi:hypothetical protein
VSFFLTVIHYTTMPYDLARKSYFYALQQGPSSCSALVQPRSFALCPTYRAPLHPSGNRGIVGIKQRDNPASLRGRTWRSHDRRATSTTEETLCHATNSKLRRSPRSPAHVGGVRIECFRISHRSPSPVSRVRKSCAHCTFRRSRFRCQTLTSLLQS